MEMSKKLKEEEERIARLAKEEREKVSQTMA